MDNFNDMHRKASDDYNNGTIDEKMCPMCGTILPGNVKFCTECGQKLSEKMKKDTSQPNVIALVAVVIIAMLTVLFGVFIMLRDMLRTTDELSESNIINSSVVSETLSSPTEPEKNYSKGHYEAGVYKIGEDIPKGTYMLMSENSEFRDMHFAGMHNDAYYGLYSDPDCNDTIDCKWFDSSAIVDLETDDYIEFTWCEAIALDVFDGENSPFEHAGMFRCGIDFEPGTYKIVPTTDQGYQMYYVHDNINAIDDKIIYTEGHHGFSEGTEVTVKEGEILELSWCILEKINKLS